ncbi:MAG: PAS domain-containing protein [Spirosomataceae bacterium]
MSENQLIPIYRNGKMEDVYWTFSHSPVYDSIGNPTGILVTCTETTSYIKTLQELEKKKDELEFAIEAAELGTFDYNLLTNTFKANSRFRNWFGLGHNSQIQPSQLLELIDQKDQERIVNEVKEILKNYSRGIYSTEYTIQNPNFKKEIVIKSKGKIWFNDKKKPYRFNGTLQDITEDKEIQEKIKLSESNLRLMILQAPIAIAIFKGADYQVTILNNSALAIIGRKESEIINRPLFHVMPELASQGIKGLLDEVYQTKNRFSATELPVQMLRNEVLEIVYINLSFEPLFHEDGTIDGIMAIGIDVTEQVVARHKVESNEEKLNIVIDASELGTWELDLQTSEVQYSDRYLEILGHKRGTLLTHPQIVQHLHPSDLGIRAKAFEEAFATGILYYQSRIIWNDNTIHWIEGKGKVFYDDHNKPKRMLGTVQDITQEKLIQQELEEREKKFRLLADSMPQFVWTSDPEGNLNYFNQSVFNYSGLSSNQIQKDGWIQIVHPEDRKENIKKWINSITTGEDFLFEHRFRRYDGEYRWQLSRATPQKDENGVIQRWVGTSTDIQSQKVFTSELEKQVSERTHELKQKNIDLEKSNKELESFAYISSHDLQEPLRKIQTFASRIIEKEESNLSETGKDYFNRMQNAADRMQTLIQDLLAYSRTNTAEKQFEPIALKDIVEEVKQDLKEELEQKQATVQTIASCTVNVIHFQFRQLLINLVSNALKFSKSSTLPYITISSELGRGEIFDNEEIAKDKLYCHICITDNGIGFEQQYSEKIFELFQRLNSKEKYKGTGIGLAIVKKIVENHRGIITAKSAKDKGATFHIYLPYF